MTGLSFWISRPCGTVRWARTIRLNSLRCREMASLLGVMRATKPVGSFWLFRPQRVLPASYWRTVSGKEAVLPSPPPLRTARDSFPSSSSSLSNAQGRTRFRYIQPSAMDLSMAVRVEEYTVVRPI